METFYNVFKKKIIFFALKKLEKTPSKVAQKNSNPLFFLTASSAQTAQTEEFMFQNVAYRPTVYRTGHVTFTVIFEKKLMWPQLKRKTGAPILYKVGI